MKEYFSNLKQKMTAIAGRLKLKQIFALLVKVYNKFFSLINRMGAYLAKIGIKANIISWTGFIIGIFAINFVAMEMYGWALSAILLNRLCDALDGAVARHSKPNDFGVFLDASLDYIFYGGVIFGFALANPAANALAAAFLLFGFASAACTMLAYSVIAYKNSAAKHPNLHQSPFYLGGLAQGSETLIALVILCLVPRLFGVVALVLGALSLLKAFSVIVAAYYSFVIAPYKKTK